MGHEESDMQCPVGRNSAQEHSADRTHRMRKNRNSEAISEAGGCPFCEGETIPHDILLSNFMPKFYFPLKQDEAHNSAPRALTNQVLFLSELHLMLLCSDERCRHATDEQKMTHLVMIYKSDQSIE